jgi:MerR family redox-sensitive transcriptional activator SoxR
VLRRIGFIRVSQRVGISLDDIRRALEELPDNRTPTEQDWARLAKAWREDLDSRIEQLLRLRDNLTDCIGCGCLTIGACRLYNPYDKLGSEGPGPRRVLTEATEVRPRAAGSAPAASGSRSRK